MDFESGKYSDGFFDINDTNGFLPLADPLAELPEQFSELQNLTDKIPEYVNYEFLFPYEVKYLPNYLEQIKEITDVFVLQALFRAYAILSSAYLLQPSHLNQTDGKYGVARQVLPANIAQPFECVANKLNVFPFVDYHYAYALGNYIKINPNLPINKVYEHTNLKLACSFSGKPDEKGFIMLHVDIVSKTASLIAGIKQYLEGDKLGGLNVVLAACLQINSRRREMWNASNHRNYNDFRAFIMGIKGNTEIFGDGVIYEGCEDTSKRQYRGQTGAQDDTIPTLDIFTGVTKYYPENELTKYLLDLRQYRPVVFQKFFEDLQQNTVKVSELDTECKKVLYKILVEIYNFRNGHWQFVQKYILENTRYATATGGTPITTWIPNQIGAVLAYMFNLLMDIEDYTFYENEIGKLIQRSNILKKQQHTLLNPDYDAAQVYADGAILNEFSSNNDNEHKTKRKCPFSNT